MKKLFFTGLITLLPFTLTLLIVIFIINIFTTPFQSLVTAILDYYNFLDTPFLFFSRTEVLNFISKFLIIIILVVFTILMGFIARMMIANTFFRFTNRLIERIPLVNKVYRSIQDVTKTLFMSSGASFSQVALVPFPHSKVYCIGFLSIKQTEEIHSETVQVFIPGTPNPTGGFLLSYKYEEVIFLDMKVDDALKFILSCGIMFPGFTKEIDSRDNK